MSKQVRKLSCPRSTKNHKILLYNEQINKDLKYFAIKVKFISFVYKLSLKVYEI